MENLYNLNKLEYSLEFQIDMSKSGYTVVHHPSTIFMSLISSTTKVDIYEDKTIIVTHMPTNNVQKYESNKEMLSWKDEEGHYHFGIKKP